MTDISINAKIADYIEKFNTPTQVNDQWFVKMQEGSLWVYKTFDTDIGCSPCWICCGFWQQND